ncbi:hypothetical protein BH24CHL8_BH24CHL8_10460 [soil metagenome]
MDDQRVGAIIRAVRRRRGWRQSDLAQLAGVHQAWVSLAERGHLGRLRVDAIRRIGVALDIGLPFDPRWRGADLARLLDEDHAALVENVVRSLRESDWEVIVEYSFNHYGDRGSVDIVGWHAETRTLLIIEVKSRLADVQDLHATMDRKCRVVPGLLARERGWRALNLGRVLVVADTTTVRRTVLRHASIFAAALPERTSAVRGWLRGPTGSIAGIWFLPPITRRDGKQISTTSHRVRVAAQSFVSRDGAPN